MKQNIKYIFPRKITFKKIKEWFFTRPDNIHPELQNAFFGQASISLYILIFLVSLVSFFIFIISLFSNINIFLLVKSLSLFIPLFVIILLLHKVLKGEKKDYYLLLFSVFIIATWGISKDIVNFSIIFNRYGILYISLLFFGLIFMPFPPYISLLLGLYCSSLYGILWFLFIYRIFDIQWLVSTGNALGVEWLNEHIKLITTGKQHLIRHWQFHSTWYFFQYMIYGIIAAIFRAASIQTYIKTFETKQKLLSAEAGLDAIQNLTSQKEDQFTEFKSSARWDYNTNRTNKELEQVIVKTIAGFMNSEGGTLVLGVDDEGNPIGLEKDYLTLKKKNKDGYELFLINLISNYLGKEYCGNVNISFFTIKDKEISSLTIQLNDKPVFVEQMGQALYIRTGNSTQKLNTKEALEYIQKHFD